MTFAYARRRQSPRHTGHWSPSLGASNIQHSDVQGQRAQPAKGSTAKTTTRADVVENARRTAFARTVSSRLKTVGVTAPGPSGGIDSSQVAQLESRFVAQRMFDWEQPNMGQVGDILGTMITHLSPGMKWEASAQDKVCKERKFTAYVVGHRPPIHLCPRFFTSGPEQQIRTLVHESAPPRRHRTERGRELLRHVRLPRRLRRLRGGGLVVALRALHEPAAAGQGRYLHRAAPQAVMTRR